MKPRLLLKIATVALVISVGCGETQRASAIGTGDADTAINSYNAAFLVTSGNTTYYKKALNDASTDGFWTEALDIEGEEDAYERTGDPAQQAVITKLLDTFLTNNPPPWSWDGWNDDIGWVTNALARGYQMTGNAKYLTQAEYGFNYAYDRGWDTQYNGGGIWEQQPSYTPAGEYVGKNTLACDSLGKTACMLYQCTHDQAYLNKAAQIYAWVRATLYDPNTGQVYTSIDRGGTVDKSTAVYNQGTFIDYANLLYGITGAEVYLGDAKRAADYTINNLTVGGIVTNNAGYLNTWADELARGLGHMVRDNRLWSTYYPFMLNNANAAWNNRRTDYNVTWNGWNQATPLDPALIPTKCVSAVAWLQFTPAVQPSDIQGIHTITSALNGIAIDNDNSAGSYNGQKAGVVLYGYNAGSTQRWNFKQNADASWFITSQTSFQVLENGSSSTNGAQMIQWPFNGGSNQRWWVDQQADGTYKIWNQADAKALDSSSSSQNRYPLVQWGWNGEGQQRWKIQ